MAITIQPKTLESARLARGLSLAALAKKCGISSPTLSRIESASREATSDEIKRIAQALDLPEKALLKPLVSESLGLSAFYHRKLTRANARSVRSIENQCLLNASAIHQLVGLIDLPDCFSIDSIQLDSQDATPEYTAQLLRAKLQLPRGPIHNLFEIVEGMGCLVIHFDFGIPEMDALYQQAPGVPPIFWVNSSKPMDRVRFSVAHELGHLVLHEERPTHDRDAEKEANEFASAFLMPRSDFRGECPIQLGLHGLIEMKRRWRCSMSAIAYRAREIGRITDRHYTNLMINLSKRDWRKNEPYPIEGETPFQMRRYIDSTLDELNLSMRELAELLAVPLDTISDWRQPFPGHREDPNEGGPRLRIVP